MATHSRILARIIPWTEEPGGLQSTRSHRVGHDWVTELNWAVLIVALQHCISVLCTAKWIRYMYTYILIFRRRKWHPTPGLLPGKSHGQRSLVGCSPLGCWESDMTEQLHFHFSLSCIGEGNGNPLQCSCLENPRDGGAWWAAVYGVAQCQTRLKQLSSSILIFGFPSQLGHHRALSRVPCAIQ